MAFIPRDEVDRLKAFDLSLNASNGGKFRPLRSIASEVGVSSVTIARWKEVDHWDDKLNKALATTANTQESTSNAAKRKGRQGVLDCSDELHRMAADTSLSAKDRIDAIKAISAVALKIDAITSGT